MKKIIECVLVLCFVVIFAVVTVAACGNANSSGGQGPDERAVSSPSPAARVAVGQAFFQSVELAMGDPSNPSGAIPVSVTVKTLKCGISSFAFEASSASGAIPNDQPARASPGNQFCQATVTVKNSGREPIRDVLPIPVFDTTLTAGNNTYRVDSLSEAIVFTLNQQNLDRGVNPGPPDGEAINPGATATLELVWQIPESATADSINFVSPPTTVNAR
jgi:hypothetical protein